MGVLARKWFCSYGNGRVGEIVAVTTAGDYLVSVHAPGATAGRRWAVASFASAIAKANELAGQSSHAREWVEANRD